MSTLLRKVKSTITATPSTPQDTPSPSLFPSTKLPGTQVRKSRLKKVHSCLEPSLSATLDKSSPTLPPTQPDHPLTEFRRRLARKASTFSLRTKRWKSELQERSQEEAREGQKHQEDILCAIQGGPIILEDQKSKISPDTHLGNRQDTVIHHKPSDSDRKAPLQANTADPKPLSSSVQALIRETQQGYTTKEQAGGKTLVKMASEQAAPPVPYTRLKEITENACGAALSSVTAYSHADTESWNTTIINSILGALVEETGQASASASSPAQPQFKYVVNSTIIQHAAASSSAGDEAKKITGRRGMHAASGAYWNNEKDGMWSYKYPGAESKGLDVVIGIIWVWVG